MDFGSEDMTLHMRRLRSEVDTKRYEKVFAVDPKEFSSYPKGEGPQDGAYWDTDDAELYPAVVSRSWLQKCDTQLRAYKLSVPHSYPKHYVSCFWTC